MRLGIISQGFSPDKYSGGIGRYYSELIEELKKKIEIHVFTETERKNEGNLFFHSVKPKKIFLPPVNNYLNAKNYSKKFFEKLSELKNEIDLVEGPLGMLNSFHYSKNKFTPLITSIQTPLSEGLTKRSLFLDRKMVYNSEKSIVKNSDAIVTATNYAKEGIVKDYFRINHPKIVTINQGISTEKFRPMKTEKKFDEPIVLFVGRIEPRKGLKVLIEAMPFVKEKAKLIVVGEELNQSLPYHREVMDSIERNSVKEIDFFGYQSEEKLIELYNKADLIVEPSFSESACYVLIEGMACGKAVIASSIGGMSEIALKELQFKAGDSRGLAERIDFLLENEGERKNLEKKARERIVKEYSIKKSAETYFNLYSSF
ncbi:MAG: glycosyltransferase family 4 protein [archaeon]